MTRSGRTRDIRMTAKARPTMRARTKASTETTMVSHAPRKRSGRKAGISSRANIEILPGWVQVESRLPSSPRKRGSRVSDARMPLGPCLRRGDGTEIQSEKIRLVVVADETPFGEDLLHLHVVFHPLDGGGEGGHQLDVGLAEGIAAIAIRVLEGARLVILDHVDLPLRMILHLGGDHRLVVEHGIDAAESELRHHLLPVLVALHGDARYRPQPLGVVGAEQGPGFLAGQVLQAVD